MKKNHKLILTVVLGGIAVWGIASYVNNKKKEMALQKAKDAATVAAAAGANNGMQSVPTMTVAQAGLQSGIDWRVKEQTV